MNATEIKLIGYRVRLIRHKVPQASEALIQEVFSELGCMAYDFDAIEEIERRCPSSKSKILRPPNPTPSNPTLRKIMPQIKPHFVIELAPTRKGPWRLSEVEDRFPTARLAYPHALRLWTAKRDHGVWIRVVRARQIDPSVALGQQPDTRRAVYSFLPIRSERKRAETLAGHAAEQRKLADNPVETT
jgi:hypothetical protein